MAQVNATEQGITLEVAATGLTARCPLCQRRSRRVNSIYQRTVADLPWSGRPVTLQVRVRRFICQQASCPRRIFAERFPALVAVYARRTYHLCEGQRRVGLALGGEAGARLAAPLGMPTSPTTLLRLERTAPLPPIQPPRIIGIDDWAWRRGHRYGTILVDLERHCPIDLLPHRSAASAAAWLRAHPEITVVSRDRASL